MSCFLFRVPETLPLYDILNEFQKGLSHMAVVVRQCDKIHPLPSKDAKDGKLFTLVGYK